MTGGHGDGSSASLSDVASSAGVSLATASRVLSNSPHAVAETTRRRVLSAAGRLDFVPNLVARGLVARRTSTFGVIVHDMTDEYFAQIARGFEDAAYACGMATMICNSDRQPDKELAYVRKLRSMQVDAMVFTGSGPGDSGPGDPHHQTALQLQLVQYEADGRVVVCLAPGHGRPADVIWPTRDGFADAVAHLVALGHRRIGYVGGPELLASSHERLAAARSVLAAAGLELPESAVYPGDYTRKGGVAGAARIMAGGERHRPTALLAANDQLAIGLITGLRTAGLEVPGDMSIVGFDDVPSCAFVEPRLTTIRVPLYEVGAIGAQMAIDLLGGHAREQVTVPVELVVRASTAPPAG